MKTIFEDIVEQQPYMKNKQFRKFLWNQIQYNDWFYLQINNRKFDVQFAEEFIFIHNKIIEALK